MCNPSLTQASLVRVLSFAWYCTSVKIVDKSRLLLPIVATTTLPV